MTSKHIAKNIDYCTHEYRGIQIRNLRRYTLSKVGWEFYFEATETDPVTEHRIASTLENAKQDIDIYLMDTEMVGA